MSNTMVCDCIENVASSTIRRVGYSTTEKSLFVEFHTGGIYKYSDVPNDVYLELLESKSKGAFLNNEVKPEYAYELLEEA